MLRKLLIALLSSWAITPLGLLLVQMNGLGANDVLKLYFLVSGVSLPFQLLLNECYAATGQKSIGGRGVARFVIFVLLAQATSAGIASRYIDLPAYAVVGATLSSSLWLLTSFMTANAFYERLRRGDISDTDSILIGALPGLVALVIYCVFIFLVKPAWLIIAPILLFVLPATSQFLLVQRGGRRLVNGPSSIGPDCNMGGYFLPGAVIFFLWLCSSEAAELKIRLAGFFPSHSAIFIYATNVVVTISSVALKSYHLGAKAVTLRKHRLCLLMVLSLALLVTFFLPGAGVVSDVGKFIASQASIICLLEVGRRFMGVLK